MNSCRIKPESFDIKNILSPETIDSLKIKTFQKGNILYYNPSLGIQLFIFKNGRAKVVFFDDGESFTLYNLGANSIFVLEENSTIEFSSESELYVLDAKVFSRLFENVQFSNLILASMVKSLEIERGIIKTLVFNDCKKRVISFMLDIANTVGSKQDNGILIDLTMNIGELSDFIASKRQTISAVLHVLMEDGLLDKIDYTKYLIKDIVALKRELA